MRLFLGIVLYIVSFTGVNAENLRVNEIPFITDFYRADEGKIDYLLVAIDEYKNYDLDEILSVFDCPFGKFKIRCALPHHNRLQISRILINSDSILNELIPEFSGEENLYYNPNDFIDRVGLPVIQQILNDSPIGRQEGAVFETGPIPVFPTISFIPKYNDINDLRLLEKADYFDPVEFQRQLENLSVYDFHAESDIMPHWISSPMSFEPVENRLFEAAWDAWNRLAEQSEEACPYTKSGCDLNFVIHSFTDGPEEYRSGFVACYVNDVHEPTYMSAPCVVMGFKTSAGVRYLKSLYGPLFAVEAGGHVINSAGFLEVQCSSTASVGRAKKVEAFSNVFRKETYGTTVPNQVRFLNPEKLAFAINEGNPLADFDDKFVFLYATAYNSGGGFWMNIVAKSWIRAEPDPSRFPMFSDTNAIKLANFLSSDFAGHGYSCSLSQP